MKKHLITAISIISLALTIAGCGKAAENADSNDTWPADWVRIGSSLVAEPPENGLKLLDNKDALSASDLYYATWCAGEKTDYVNEDDETVDLYDAQLHLLMMDCKTEAKASSNVEEWRSAEEKIYQVTETKTVSCAGQDFTLIVYTVNRKNNPYSHGASAFGVYENHAINVELSCREQFEGDAADILTGFLRGFHFT